MGVGARQTLRLGGYPGREGGRTRLSRIRLVTGSILLPPDGSKRSGRRRHHLPHGADVDAQPGTCDGTTPPTNLAAVKLLATSAHFTFQHADEGGRPVSEYEIRYIEGQIIDEARFSEGIPAPVVAPGQPGAPAEIDLLGLKPLTKYVLALRAKSSCQSMSPLVSFPFETDQLVFAQLSGCFIATAAFGKPQAEKLGGLRWARDQSIAQSPLANEAVDAYYRSSPPLAAALATSEPARAAVRVMLEPFVDLFSTLQMLRGEP